MRAVVLRGKYEFLTTFLGLAQTDETICVETLPFAQYLVNGEHHAFNITETRYPEKVTFVPSLAEVLKTSQSARILFYQTWGYESAKPFLCASLANPYLCDYYKLQDRITEGYNTLACHLAPTTIAPVGEGFRYVKDNYGDEIFKELYHMNPLDDHPSEQVCHNIFLYTWDVH